MPDVVRLPAHVGEDEVRVCWDSTEGESPCLHAFGPPGATLLALTQFTEKRLRTKGSLADSLQLRLGGLVEDAPSPLDELERAGYDPRTLVFSIRRKGAPAAPDGVPDDVRRRIEDAQRATVELARLLESSAEAVKGVRVMEEDEHSHLEDKVSAVRDALAAALDKLDGR